METLPSNQLSSSIRTSQMRKLLLGMTSLKLILYSSIFHRFAGYHWKDTMLKFSIQGGGCQSNPMEKGSPSQMATKVRTHPLLSSSLKNNLCTNVKYREFFVPPLFKKQRKSNRKTLYQVKNPKECLRSKNSSQLFPGTCEILHNSHLPVKMHCLTYYYWGFKT